MRGLLLGLTAPLWIPVLLAAGCAVTALGVMAWVLVGRNPMEGAPYDGWSADDERSA